MEKPQHTVLILSYGPVPTPEYQKIEGGGMRCWGLARGLSQNDISVTVGVNGGFPMQLLEHEGIKLMNWQLDERFSVLLSSFDAVIVSYSMGDLSMFVADHIPSTALLILDAYVPIFVEVSARDAQDKVREYGNYQEDIARHNHVLRRGDYFLCANEPQRHMYTGVLGSLGILNPYTYHQNQLLLVPFGIEETIVPELSFDTNPYHSLGIEDEDFTVLWFGGLYSWFDFGPMVEAIITLAKRSPQFRFVLIGGKNPYNAHPDFTKQYDLVRERLEISGLVGTICHFVDWVDFNKRSYWFAGADMVISVNKPGEENTYSWRTRVMDFVWGGIPMLTNGSDPLSDFLIDRHAALKIGTSSQEIVDAIVSVQDNPDQLATLKTNLNALRPRFFWRELTEVLAEKITDPFRPFQDELHFASAHGIMRPNGPHAVPPSKFSSPGAVRRIGKLLKKVRQKGWGRSAKFAAQLIVAKYSNIRRKRSGAGPKAVLLSHPIDDTGAPQVLIDVANDLKQAYASNRIIIVAPDIKQHLLRSLVAQGFGILKSTEHVGARTIAMQLDIQPDDFVLLNTVAVLQNYKEYIYGLLERGELKHAIWFIHEDKPELRLTDRSEVERIKRLIKRKLLSVCVPSEQTAQEYNAFLKTNSVYPIKLRVHVDDKLTKPRSSSDFNVLHFVISGTASDGRKGQLLLLAALARFEKNYGSVNSDAYRPYRVTFISIAPGDYISDQILAIGRSQLGDRLTTYPKIPRDEALRIMSKANVTVCVSLNETFGLFVAEGMMMGHVVLRNHSSGWSEQMEDGINGYLIKNLDIEDLSEKIAELLDVKRHSLTKLAAMGAASQRIASTFQNADYLTQLIS